MTMWLLFTLELTTLRLALSTVFVGLVAWALLAGVGLMLCWLVTRCWPDVRGWLILRFCYRDTLGHQLRWFGARLGSRHLDLACGYCTLLRLVLAWRRVHGLRPPDVVTGIDRAMLPASLRGRLRRWSGIDARQGSAYALGDIGPFDSVSIMNAVHVFDDARAALTEAKRVLAPDGRVLVNFLLTPLDDHRLAWWIVRWGFRTGRLHRTYAYAEIEQLLAATGYVISAREFGVNTCYVSARAAA